MSQPPTTERRRHRRVPLSAGVEFRHGPTRRDFPARSVDLSAGGMLMYVPATVPVRVGQDVHLRIGRVEPDELAHLSGRAVDARVVRVERGALIACGHLAIALEFAAA